MEGVLGHSFWFTSSSILHIALLAFEDVAYFGIRCPGDSGKHHHCTANCTRKETHAQGEDGLRIDNVFC